MAANCFAESGFALADAGSAVVVAHG